MLGHTSVVTTEQVWTVSPGGLSSGERGRKLRVKRAGGNAVEVSGNWNTLRYIGHLFGDSKGMLKFIEYFYVVFISSDAGHKSLLLLMCCKSTKL